MEKSAFEPIKFPRVKSIIFSDSKIESTAVKSIKSTFSLELKLFLILKSDNEKFFT